MNIIKFISNSFKNIRIGGNNKKSGQYESNDKKVEKAVVRRSHYKTWMRVVSGLSAAAMFCVTYALILPALTLEAATICGLEEHTHSDACYETILQLMCGQEERLPQAGHTHTEACYLVTENYICGFEESEGHIHTTECYDEDGNVICNIIEGEGAHRHGPECVSTTTTIICGQEETLDDPGHIHDDSCYTAVTVMTCGKIEHTHTDECFVQGDPNVDAETKGMWEKSFAEAELTGDFKHDIAAIAETQVGYQRSDRNYIIQNGTAYGYSRYGAAFSMPYAEWNVLFPLFAATYAGAVDLPVYSDISEFAFYLEDAVKYNGEYIPEIGDLIFLTVNENITVGIISEIIDDNYTVITAGDAAVEMIYVNIYDPSVTAFADLSDYKAVVPEPLETTSAETEAYTEPETVYVPDNEPEIDVPVMPDAPEMPVAAEEVTVEATTADTTTEETTAEATTAVETTTEIIITTEAETTIAETTTDETTAETTTLAETTTVAETTTEEITTVAETTTSAETTTESTTEDTTTADTTTAADSTVESTTLAEATIEETTISDTITEPETTAETTADSETTTEPETVHVEEEEPEETTEEVFDDEESDSDTTEELNEDETTDEETTNAETDGDIGPVYMPPQTYDMRPADADFTVHIEAEGGAFPNGVIMNAVLIDDEAILDTAKEAAEGEAVDVRAVDITFSDEEGNELQPEKPIRVSIILDKPTVLDTQVVHIDDEGEVTAIEVDADTAADEVAFEAESFSIYAVVYTVDFHWEVNGETFEYSIPGGGYVSFTDLVETLGIAVGDNQESVADFVVNIESISFSDPSLVWVGKVEEDTTVGLLKAEYGLECEYSEELTEEEIEQINEITVSAGDWVLISIKAFDTEENLTVTMNNGDMFVVNVTDRQDVTGTDMFDGKTEMVIWTESNGHYYALKADGTTAEFDMADFDRLGRDYLWTVTYGWQDNNVFRYYIRPVSDSSKSLDLSWDDKALSSQGSCGNLITAQNGGFVLEGWNSARLLFDSSSKTFIQKMNVQGTPVHFSKQSTVSAFNYTVTSADSSMGLVKVGNGTLAETVSGQTDSNKKNAGDIIADANGPTDSNGNKKYIFDYWDLNGEKLEDQTSPTIAIGALEFPYEGYTVTAHFKRNPSYVEEREDFKVGRTFSDDEKAELRNWLTELQNRAIPLDVNGLSKTAEVYDYENRIYRVDLTAKSNLETFDGVIDLGFIIDMSGSMQFPANLKKASVVDSSTSTSGWYVRKNVFTSDYTDLRKDYGWTENFWGGIEVSNSEGQVLIGRLNDNDTTKQILNRNKTYYYVADRSGTFTIYHMKFNWSTNRWVSSDASWTDYGDMGWNTYYKSNDPRGFYYTLYEAADNGSQTKTGSSENKDTNRKWYLENSLNNTISECNRILEKISIAKGDADNKNPDVEIAYNTFFSRVDKKSYNFESTTGIAGELHYDTDGGTGTDLALLSATGEKYSNDTLNGNVDRSNYKKQNYTSSGDNPAGFQWNTADNRYVILITDGAPQADGKAIADQYVKDAADKLKTEDNVTLITVGLSMSDVKRGSILLYDIASKDDKTGEPLFFAAEGDDLQYVLYSIVRTIMQKAIVEGNVTDTVNEAFYPVDKTSGRPLEIGNVINLAGEKIADNEGKLTNEQKAKGYGVIGLANEKYTVTWTGAEISWDGWHGTLYEKAKEDFLGGNAVKTNDPNNNAKIEATGYKFKEGDTAVALDTSGTKVPESNRVKILETPRVNVNELSFTMNDTEWTVYLGTEVDTKTQLKELLRNILVEETVTAAADTDNDDLQDRMTDTLMYYPFRESTSDQRESEGVGKRLTYPLWKLLRKLDNSNKGEDTYLEELIDKIIANNGELEYGYNLYGTSDSPGKITITLTKTGDTADYDKHVTTKTGTPAETYQLNVLFKPDYTHIPLGQGGTNPYEYHTGTYGTSVCGNASADEDSKNNHIINIFAKKLKLLKVDQSQNTITSNPATFVLYRKATEAESEDDTVTKVNNPIGLPEGNYVVAETLTTNGGSVITSALALLPDNEPYYLVEKSAPSGYIALTEPLKVTIDMTYHNTWTKVPVANPPETSQTKWNQYVLSNWLQEATVKLTDKSGNNSIAAIRDIPEGEYEITYDHINDTTGASVTYKIINSSGYELPSTGSVGTTVYTIAGTALMFIAMASIFVTRKVKTEE